jgi:hypothetical protein
VVTGSEIDDLGVSEVVSSLNLGANINIISAWTDLSSIIEVSS